MTRCAFGILAALCCVSAGEILREQRIELAGPWKALPDAAGHAIEFAVPKVDSSRHVRLTVAGLGAADRVRLNDMALETQRTAPGQYDVVGFLDHRRTNTLVIAHADPSPPGKVALLVTPRVYVQEQTVATERGRLLASVWVRNALENTVSVLVTIRLRDAAGPKNAYSEAYEGSIGVSPGTTREVRLEGAAPLTVRGPLEAVTVIEKEEEAMEGAYRYEFVSQVATKGAL